MKNRMSFWTQNKVFQKSCPLFCEGLAAMENRHSGQTLSVPEPLDDAVDNVTGILTLKCLEEKLYLAAEANFREEKAVILSGVEIIEETTGTVLATAYRDGYDTADLYVELLEQLKNMQGQVTNDSSLRAHVSFVWSDSEGQIEQTEHSYLINDLSLNAVVDTLIVKEPRAKNKKNTLILYARTPFQGESEDYSYPDNVADLKTNRVHVQIPLEGSVSINSKWGIEELIFGDPSGKEERTKLMLTLEGGGTIEYNKGDYKNTDLFTLDRENGKISFCTKHEPDCGACRKGDRDTWSVDLDISRFSAKTTLRLFLNIAVKVYNKKNPLIKRNIYIVVNSSELEVDESTLTIEPITIRWGCVSEGTMVLMADGSERSIESLHPGDMVQNANGNRVEIFNIYRGREEELLILKTEQGKMIKMTEDHPVMTENGWKRAGKLNAADRIRLYSGETVRIKELYIKPEKTTVYNLALENNEISFIGNEIIVGTMDQQNKLNVSNDRELSPRARQLQHEVKEFMQNLL